MAWTPITSLYFLLSSTITSKIIRRGANWYPFALSLRSDNRRFLNNFIDMIASNSSKIALSQRVLPFYLLNWAASLAFLGAFMPYLHPPLLGALQSFPPGLFSLARPSRWYLSGRSIDRVTWDPKISSRKLFPKILTSLYMRLILAFMDLTVHAHHSLASTKKAGFPVLLHPYASI